MLQHFQDHDEITDHDSFQEWRATHQSGTLLTLETRTRANLHGSRCSHFGAGPPYYLLDSRFHSLTVKKKICGTIEELVEWAAQNNVRVQACHHCLRDKLIINEHAMFRAFDGKDTTVANSQRFWTCHWQFRYWRSDINPEGTPVCTAGSNNFRKRGVAAGDIVYIVSLGAGQLYLGGRMTVKKIVSRTAAVRLWNNKQLFDSKEWIVDPERAGTLLNLHRRLSPALSKQLRFTSKTGPLKPFFISNTKLDNQATRGIRQLTPQSAALLDHIIAVTDELPTSDQLVTVSKKMLVNGLVQKEFNSKVKIPEEVPDESAFNEGSVQRILVNRYERDPRAREACIREYGTKCFLCSFDFVVKFGEMMDGFTHVHHLKPLSSLGSDYKINPIRDLRPVCPNCHAVLHRREPPLSLDEVRRLLQKQQACV